MADEEQIIENDIPDVAEKEAPAEPLSLREEIENAAKEVKEKSEDKSEKTDKSEKSVRPQKEQSKVASPVTEKAATSVAPPNAWTAQSKAKWAALPPEIQAEVAKREAEIHQGMTKLDEERQFGKSTKEVITPYLPMITAEGSTPQKAIQSLLNTAYLLRTSTPQEKGRMLMDLARQYGADLSQVSQQQQKPIDPELQAIRQELGQLKSARQSEVSQREQHEQATIQSEIQTFAANPDHVHYESVKAHMASLLQGGLTKGNSPQEHLRDAYDQAVYAKPDIRSTLLEQKIAQTEANRVAEKKAKADAARRAGASITGNPGATAPGNIANNNLDLREQIKAAWKEHTVN